MFRGISFRLLAETLLISNLLVTTVMGYSGGSGTSADPYRITTPADWQQLVTTAADSGKCFVLTADIDLQGVTITWAGNFAGVFDGGGHIITNATAQGNCVGLFAGMSNAVIKNLGVENVTVSATGASGGDYAGGLVGYQSGGVITNCYTTGSVGATSSDPAHTYARAGGLVGYQSGGVISNCHSTASVAANSSYLTYAGGLVGYQNGGMVNNCYSTGSATANMTSSSSGSKAYAGGLVGYQQAGMIVSCHSTGPVSASASNSSYATGSYAGGLVGLEESTCTISDCYSTSSVTGASTYSAYVGGLAGSCYGTVTNCYSTGSAGTTSCPWGYVGGLAGTQYNGTISYSWSTCSASATASSYAYAGGSVGYQANGTMSNCYARGSVTANTPAIATAGGFVAAQDAATFGKCYSTGLVTATGSTVRKGGLLGHQYSGAVTASFWDTQTSSLATSAGGTGAQGRTTAEMMTPSTFTSADWDFSDSDGDPADWVIQNIGAEYPVLVEHPSFNYSGGSGTELDPYLISTPADLEAVGTHPGDWCRYFRLTADIDMSAYTGTQYNIIGNLAVYFTGVFDGNGHTVSNLSYTTTAVVDYVGMFGYVFGGTIENLGLENANISTAGSYAGVLAGSCWAAVSNCHTAGSAASSAAGTPAAYAGGLVGYQGNGTITDCYSMGSASASTIGSPAAHAGGLVGYQGGGTITDCHSTASAGAITAGAADGSSACAHAGGLVGYQGAGTVSRCYSTGSVSATNTTGYYSTSDVYAGGLVGYQSGGAMADCYSSGPVSAQSFYYSARAGGLIGISAGTVVGCYSTGPTSINDSHWAYAGGLIGTQSGGAVSNCYARGAATTSTNVQGFAGGLMGSHSSGTLTDCYSTGVATANGIGALYAGGFLGSHSSGAITACFWDTQTSGTSSGIGSGSSGGVVGLYTYQMTTRSTYTGAGWDFSWTDGDAADWALFREGTNYPALMWQQLSYHGGSGTEASPWNIANADELLYLSCHPEQWSKCFVLTAAINLTGYTGTQYGVIGNDTTKFTGTFDGAGYAISNLTWSTAAPVDCAGLFGYVSNATIRNLGVENVAISTGGRYAGALIGRQENGTVTNCYSTGSASANSALGAYAGGLVGLGTGVITNCYSTASAGATSTFAAYAGGLVGYQNGGTITDCYTTGVVTTSGTGVKYGGGLLGYRSACTVAASFWNTATSGVSAGIGYGAADGIAGKSASELKTTSTYTDAGWDFFWTDGDEPDWVICNEGVTYPILQCQPHKYGGGVGTEARPYLIYSRQNLNAIGSDPCDWNKHFKVMLDIDMSAYTGTQYHRIGSPSAPFTGVFDGNGHKVVNLNYSFTSGTGVGLFGYTSGATIRNLGIENAVISGQGQIAGAWNGILVAGQNGGTITNCYATGSISVFSYYGLYAGGLAGYLNGGTITNCCSRATISLLTDSGSASACVGGLVGRQDSGTIAGCCSTGPVSATSADACAGGLVGYQFGGVMTDCYSIGSAKVYLSGSSPVGYVGGLVGQSSGTIGNCYSTGLVGKYNTGTAYVGGLIGRQNSGAVTASFWDTLTSGQPTSAGGTGKITVEMKALSTFAGVGWDFTNTWAICQMTNYPRLRWQILPGDFVCPDGVGFDDLAVLFDQWLNVRLSVDIAPVGGDGIVNFRDWAAFVDGWQGDMAPLSQFVEQWLRSNAYCADIAPAPEGDGVVNMLDFALLASHWLEGR